MDKSPTRYNAPLQVILMFVIIIATILLGFYMLPGSEEERNRLLDELGTTNHGEFLKPVREVAALDLTGTDGAPWEMASETPKWHMFVLSGSSCDDACRELLYLSRQVHIRLAKNAHRLERVLVVTRDALTPQLAATLEQEHPYLKVVHAELPALEKWLQGTNSEWSPTSPELILVDPAGVAMMRYEERHSGIDMLEDLNHLLKYSND